MFASRNVHEEGAWGVVVGKGCGAADGSHRYHCVEVRLVDGATVKARIGKAPWGSLAVGDRLIEAVGATAAVRL
ncbi:hypothetical protein LK07_03420 [Streptomyces pluripotens]|uniref:DUF7489 domain-containing protein n=1 Tax=Streptomyces pluripotens TaxID=1355015 RepID=A0A221NTE9_9ACTN|nr:MULTISPECIES: hypothetical protein [Streptomyces]ARP68983.1 hypothetical protein LK06_002335 [Streptomyces pluripotens]ASN23241.1 hypothetical protein LK07_03420 [Streptomyces pluripotens]KIE25759.1 hypothetical protein LK08_16885 [Streptomyces sp. MUSC 125]MCH0556979.1 hypothetical protein [Streptomyces sp. MUM 16J]